MKNYVHRGLTLTLTAPRTLSSGDGALVGNIFGVASCDYTSGDSGEFAVSGVFDLAKDTSSSSFSQGDFVYWDNSAFKATSTVSTNKLIGRAEATAIQAATTVRVRLGDINPVSYPSGTDGQLLVGQTGTNPAFETVSGDISITAGGVTAIGAKKVKTGMMDDTLLHYVEVDISAADIIDTTAGKLSHANGQILLAAPGTGKVIELISAVLAFTYGGAQFSGGSNASINYAGGSAITGIVSNSNSFGASADKLYQFVPLAAAATAMVKEVGLNLVLASSVYTNGGSATGTAKVFITYRIHTL